MKLTHQQFKELTRSVHQVFEGFLSIDRAVANCGLSPFDFGKAADETQEIRRCLSEYRQTAESARSQEQRHPAIEALEALLKFTNALEVRPETPINEA